MKTAKMMLMVAFFAFGMTLFTQAEPDVRIVKIKITEVYNVRGLVKEMHAQLNLSEILNSTETRLYSARVDHRGVVYEIWGTREQWVAFFIGSDPDNPSIGRELPPAD